MLRTITDLPANQGDSFPVEVVLRSRSAKARIYDLEQWAAGSSDIEVRDIRIGRDPEGLILIASTDCDATLASTVHTVLTDIQFEWHETLEFIFPDPETLAKIIRRPRTRVR